MLQKVSFQVRYWAASDCYTSCFPFTTDFGPVGTFIVIVCQPPPDYCEASARNRAMRRSFNQHERNHENFCRADVDNGIRLANCGADN
jgi:hypothetical protein